MHVDSTEKLPRVLSLCSGYGGLERGLEIVFGGISVLTHVEIEAFAVANLVAKMETGQMVPTPIWTNLKTFRAGCFRGVVDILTGGYPCQPFSAAGKRLGNKDPRHLWPYVRATIRACEPRWVFLENVEGHLSKGIAEVLSDLEAMAYKTIPGVFSAAEVGAPHQRKRVFILAHRNRRGLSKPDFCTKQSGRTETISTGQDVGYTACHNERRDTKSALHRTWQSIRGSSWPARPGEPQYPWEEPRTVADSEQRGSDWRGNGISRGIGQSDETVNTPTVGGSQGHGLRQTKSRLGGAAHASGSRVDRLRLLGNGVVDLTAAKAYVTLREELMQ